MPSACADFTFYPAGRGAAAILAGLLLAHCGQPAASDDAAAILSSPEACAEPPCGVSPVPDGVQDAIDSGRPQPVVDATAAALTATPGRVTFYSDFEAESQPLEQQVVIHNATQRQVLLTRAFLVDDPTTLAGQGAARYFSVRSLTAGEADDGAGAAGSEGGPDAGEDLGGPVLSQNEDATLTVLFTPSAEQRSALLVVETTHPEFPVLAVQLEGKFFTEPW